MTFRHLAASAALVLLPVVSAQPVLAAIAAPAANARTYSLSGDDVAIWNPAGEVRVEAGSGSRVEVQVTLAGRDAGEVTVSTERVHGRPALRVLYPGNRIVYPALGRWSNTSTNIGRDGTWGMNLGGSIFSGRRISVKGSGDGIEAWADLVVRVPKGHKVSVYTLAGGGELQGVDGDLRFDGGAGGVRADACRGSLVVDVGSGGVQVQDFAGELLVDTGSGSIRANGIRGTSVRLDTGSGGVTGDGIVADDLDVDTGSGSVELMGVDARRARVDTGSGSVEVGLLTSSPDLSIDTGSGSVRVSVPQSLSARLHVETGSGGIRSELPLTVDERDHGTLRGTIGSGTGRVHVSTGSGGVAVLASASAPRARSTR
jgi:hypothetical protein